MGGDFAKTLVFFVVLAALFGWSVWAGLAAIGLVALWIASLFLHGARKKHQLRTQSRARIEEALAAQGLQADSIVCSYLGAGALGISRAGRKLVFTAPESLETTVYDSDSALEARGRKLPQGDFELAITVPGRVSGKPREHAILVSRRGEAERWLKALEPLLAARVRSDL
jgi:hypothetical protein